MGHVLELGYLHSWEVTFAVLCRGPFDGSDRYREFIGWETPWYSVPSPPVDSVTAGRHFGMCICWLAGRCADHEHLPLGVSHRSHPPRPARSGGERKACVSRSRASRPELRARPRGGSPESTPVPRTYQGSGSLHRRPRWNLNHAAEMGAGGQFKVSSEIG